MQTNFLKYIWANTRSSQIWMALVILASMPFYFFSLELPKRIINGPIQGDPTQVGGGTGRFLDISLPFSERFFGEPLVLFDGFELSRLPMLLALCVTLLVLVILNGWFKLYINTFKGKTSERVLRRMRYEMFDRVLRFPVSEARQVKAAEVSGIIKDEVEPLADFIGESYSGPLFLSGQAITGLTFLFLQNIWFGLLTVIIVTVQFLIIPILRRRLIELGKERQITARVMGGRIGEILQGIDDVHVNDTSNYARADLTHRLGDIFFIRLELFKRKFLVKFINNLLMQSLSILFYLIGGYFVIVGQLDIGALVASIAAYKDLPGPISGLINWDQQRQMAQVRYFHAIEGFLRSDLAPATLQSEDRPGRIETGYDVRQVGVRVEGAQTLLEGASLHMAPGDKVAVIARPTESGVLLLQSLARLIDPTSGRIHLDGADLAGLPESLTGRVVGYADSSTFLPSGKVRDLFTEVLRNRPMRKTDAEFDRGSAASREAEARRAGNPTYDFLDDWTDYERVGASSEEALIDHMEHVARCVRLYEDICVLGINSPLRDETGAITARIVEARGRLRAHLAASGLEAYVEPFDSHRYHMQSSVAENILFGMPLDPAFDPQNLAHNQAVSDLLDASPARRLLVELGLEVARTFTEMLGSDSDSALFETVTGLTPERIEQMRQMLARIDRAADGTVDKDDEDELIALAMNYVEPRDRFGLMSDELQAAILELRRRLHQHLEGVRPPPVAFYDESTYSPSLTISENILFGRIATNLVGGRARIAGAVREVLKELDLLRAVFVAGLNFEVGTGGKGLTDGQRQKLRLARALMKKPDIVILNHPLGAYPSSEQKAILESVLEGARNQSDMSPGIICAPVDPSHAALFERVIMLEDGHLTKDGASSTVLDHADAEMMEKARDPGAVAEVRE